MKIKKNIFGTAILAILVLFFIACENAVSTPPTISGTRVFTATVEHNVVDGYTFSNSDGAYILEYTDSTEASSTEKKTASLTLSLGNLQYGAPVTVEYVKADTSVFLGEPAFNERQNSTMEEISVGNPTLKIGVELKPNPLSDQEETLTLKLSDRNGTTYDTAKSPSTIKIIIKRNKYDANNTGALADFTAAMSNMGTDYYFDDSNRAIEYTDSADSAKEAKTASIKLELAGLKAGAPIKIDYTVASDVEGFIGAISTTSAALTNDAPNVQITIPIAAITSSTSGTLTLKFLDVNGNAYTTESLAKEITIPISRNITTEGEETDQKFSATVTRSDSADYDFSGADSDYALVYTDTKASSGAEKTVTVDLALGNLKTDAPIRLTYATLNGNFITKPTSVALTAEASTVQIPIVLASNPNRDQTGKLTVTFSDANGVYDEESLTKEITISITRNKYVDNGDGNGDGGDGNGDGGGESDTPVSFSSTINNTGSSDDYVFTPGTNGNHTLTYADTETSADTAKTATIDFTLAGLKVGYPITLNYATSNASFITAPSSVEISAETSTVQITIPVAANASIDQNGILALTFSGSSDIYDAESLAKEIKFNIIRNKYVVDNRTFTADIVNAGEGDYGFSGSNGNYALAYTDNTEMSAGTAKIAPITLTLTGLKADAPVTLTYATSNDASSPNFIGTLSSVEITKDAPSVTIRVPVASNPNIDQAGRLTLTFSDENEIYDAESLAKEIQFNVTRKGATPVSGFLTVTAKYLKNISVRDENLGDAWGDGKDDVEFIYAVRSRSYSGTTANEWNNLSEHEPNNTGMMPAAAKRITKGTTLPLGGSKEYAFTDRKTELSLELDSRIIEIDINGNDEITDYEKSNIAFTYDRFSLDKKWFIKAGDKGSLAYNDDFTVGLNETKDLVVTVNGMELCYEISWRTDAEIIVPRAFTVDVTEAETNYMSGSDGNYAISIIDETEEASKDAKTVSVDLLFGNLHTDVPINVEYVIENDIFNPIQVGFATVTAENSKLRVDIPLTANANTEQIGKLTLKLTDESGRGIYNMGSSPNEIEFTIRRDQKEGIRKFSFEVEEVGTDFFTVSSGPGDEYTINAKTATMVPVTLTLENLKADATIELEYIIVNADDSTDFITKPSTSTILSANNPTLTVNIPVAGNPTRKQSGTLTVTFTDTSGNTYNAESVSQQVKFNITRKAIKDAPPVEVTTDFIESVINLNDNITFINNTITDTTGDGFIASFDLNIGITSSDIPLGDGNPEIVIEIGDYVKTVGDANFPAMYFGNDESSTTFSYTPGGPSPKLTVVYKKSFGEQEGSLPITFSYDSKIYEAGMLPLSLKIASLEGKPDAVTIQALTETKEDTAVEITGSGTYTLHIADSAPVTVKETKYAVPLSLNLLGVIAGYPVKVTAKDAASVTVSDINVTDGTVTFTATHSGNTLQNTEGTVTLTVAADDYSAQTDYAVYTGLPLDIVINTERDETFSHYIGEYKNNFTASTASASNIEGGKYYTGVTIPSMNIAGATASDKVTYEIFRKDERSTEFKSIHTSEPVSVNTGFEYKDYNAFILRNPIQEYKIKVTHGATTVESTTPQTGSRMLTNRELFLAAMDSMRYGLIDQVAHVDVNTVNAGGGAFKHDRSYNGNFWAWKVSYSHTYTLTNYKPHFMSVGGNFKYTGNIAGYGIAVEDSIDTVNNGGGMYAPFHGTVNFTSPYGNGSITFDNVNIDNNTWGNPSWANGNFSVVGGGKTVTYDKNGDVPFGLYMESYQLADHTKLNKDNYTQK